jgi:hypothetical protein
MELDYFHFDRHFNSNNRLADVERVFVFQVTPLNRNFNPISCRSVMDLCAIL